jgi:HD-like signal output (HDOD) protein
LAAIPNKPAVAGRAVVETKQQTPQGAHVGALAPTTPEELKQTLAKIFQSPDYRPPVLPRVALQIASLTRQASVSYNDVVAALQKDPLIAGSVLKVAQSPVYGGRRPVRSLDDALKRLGVNNLRDVVWQVITGRRLFRAHGCTAFMERLQAHNLFVAHAARMIAGRVSVIAEEAFLCGLLHDVGLSAVLTALSDTGKPMPPLGMLLEACDAIHEEIGGSVAALWQLSPDVVLVIKQHHRFNPHVSGIPLLTAVMCVAEHLAEEVGHGAAAASPGSSAERLFDRQAEATHEHAVRRLGLAGKHNELLKEAKELADKLANSEP